MWLLLLLLLLLLLFLWFCSFCCRCCGCWWLLLLFFFFLSVPAASSLLVTVGAIVVVVILNLVSWLLSVMVIVILVMVMSHLFQQQQLSIKQLRVTVIFNGDPQPFLYTEQTIGNLIFVCCIRCLCCSLSSMALTAVDLITVPCHRYSSLHTLGLLLLRPATNRQL